MVPSPRNPVAEGYYVAWDTEASGAPLLARPTCGGLAAVRRSGCAPSETQQQPSGHSGQRGHSATRTHGSELPRLGHPPLNGYGKGNLRTHSPRRRPRRIMKRPAMSSQAEPNYISQAKSLTLNRATLGSCRKALATTTKSWKRSQRWRPPPRPRKCTAGTKASQPALDIPRLPSDSATRS
jgi:hypothetical protein